MADMGFWVGSFEEDPVGKINDKRIENEIKFLD